MENPRGFLLALFHAALEAAAPARVVPPFLPAPPSGRTLVVGAGKAAAAMAAAVESHWTGALSGLVITRYGHGADCRRIEIVEAGHPVPDSAGAAAALRMLEAVHGLGPDDLVLSLISGGGSSLFALPAPGLTLEDKQSVTRALLKSGAPISDINCVRKHVSAVKGGRLALAAYPARIVSLIVSDVPGDDPATVASGPSVPDPTTRIEARAILDRYGVDIPPRVRAFLERPEAETPKPGDPRFARVENYVIACARDALAAASGAAARAGVDAILLGDALEGEARALAAAHAALVKEKLAAPGRKKPLVLISGGETTVRVTGAGRGGRNSEYVLALAQALAQAQEGAPNVFALACDTDGIDGTEDNAGAIATPDTLVRARVAGWDAAGALAANDSYGFFQALGDLVHTGPTRTNVNDFRAILILP